ncbi:Nucleoporin nup40 [Neolecta irregularis DAH-3]|uniref:Nucleoporin nup40 n=1 Tax=Neolecta irregularis (strain DAH-3) TaxID=1198029 RepID=A0A1U7LR32_NEOID|nr:Nucleoporin nup40 [Neolecta irregularis DAH-3]|eukprot:OLL25117.1 Nucleoporin nup40 [Neolecta irregularis DAH-3]
MHRLSSSQPFSTPAHDPEQSSPRFGGPSFGSPRPAARRASAPRSRLDDDPPPLASLYDSVAAPQTPASSPPISSSTTNPDPDPALCVVLFGFPPALTSHVLAFFQKFGPITSYSSNLATGNNWLKITYADAHSAHRAVAANGAKIGGSYMVGCVYASDSPQNPDLMDLDAPPAPNSYLPRTVSMPILQSSAAPAKRITVLGGEGIFKSDSKKESAWWPAQNKETPPSTDPRPQGNSFFSRIGKLLVDGLFGF